jgi:hypothetical protein
LPFFASKSTGFVTGPGLIISSLQTFPTWHSKEDLNDYAYDCCMFRQLTLEERELFGLPQR